MTDTRRDFGRRAWAPSGGEFNSAFFGKRVARPEREPGASLDRPPLLAPECPVGGRAEALAALDKMHRERPLRPPGRRA